MIKSEFALLLFLIFIDLFLTIIFSSFFFGFILYLISLLNTKLLFIKSFPTWISSSLISFSSCIIVKFSFDIFSNFIGSFFTALISCPSHFLISKLINILFSSFLFPLKVNCSIKFCLISNLGSFFFFALNISLFSFLIIISFSTFFH